MNFYRTINFTKSKRCLAIYLAVSTFIFVIVIRQRNRHDDETDGECTEGNSKDCGTLQRMSSFTGERLVHLDLKGAPPSVEYLLEFLKFVRHAGATGILIEYEDMFPYSNELSDIKAHNAYTRGDLKKILDAAESNNLIVIPLIQTFGHLEFVLKLEKYEYLREVTRYPEALCPSHRNTSQFLRTMIDQVVAAHPLSRYLHIGCDEVYQLGECPRCQKTMNKDDWNKLELYVSHIKRIARYVSQVHGIRPIIWGDRILDMATEIIEKHNVPQMADVMLWNYRPNFSDRIGRDFFQRQGKLFKSFWIAGAFKGATGPAQITTDRNYHLANAKSWMEIVAAAKARINFKGFVLTGWQRYDHFGVLCELLPVGIPSLVTILQFLNTLEDVSDSTLTEKLQCENAISIRDVIYEPSSRCRFPGFSLYKAILYLKVIIDKIQAYPQLTNGWFKPYNILTRFSSPNRVEYFVRNFPIEELKRKLKSGWLAFVKHASAIYDNHTIEEWAMTNVVPHYRRLDCLAEAEKALLTRKHWPRRPILNATKFSDLNAITHASSNGQIDCALLTA